MKSPIHVRAVATRSRRERWTLLLRAFLLAPCAAALPLLMVGYLAYLSGYESYRLYVEAFFQLVTLALPIAFLIGIPMHLIVTRLGWTHAFVYAAAGVGIACIARELFGDESGAPWGAEQWGALLLYGAFAGWLLRRSLPRV